MNEDWNLSTGADDIEFGGVRDAETLGEKIYNSTSEECKTTSKDDTLDTLSDLDLEKFEREQDVGKTRNICETQNDETASLSDFYNVSGLIQKIRIRLDSFLKANQENSEASSKFQSLEENIAALKEELESYLKAIDAKKEQELRQFSENMINEERLLKMKKAFKLQSNFYETLGSKHYAIANNDSIPRSFRCNGDTIRVKSGFTFRNYYDNDYAFENFSESSSVEFYTMLINEHGEENNFDAPRERVSLIFRDPEEVIRQWQNYQQKTLRIKSKEKPFQTRIESKPVQHDAFWGFTLSSYQNETLLIKLKKERQTR